MKLFVMLICGSMCLLGSSDAESENNTPVAKQYVLYPAFSQRPETQYRAVNRPLVNTQQRPVNFPFRYRWIFPAPVGRPRQQSANTQDSRRINPWRLLLVYAIAQLFASRNQQAASTTTSAPSSASASTGIATTTMNTVTSMTTLGASGCGTWGSWTSCSPESERYRARLCFRNPEAESQSCEYRCESWSRWSDCKPENRRDRQRVCTGNNIERNSESCAYCSEWEEWSACPPGVSGETRTRQRVCGGITEDDEEPCPEPDVVLTEDGWYPADNSYDYRLVPTDTEHSQIEQVCAGLDSTSHAASAGVIDGTTVVNLIHSTFGVDTSIPVVYFVSGLADATGKWLFLKPGFNIVPSAQLSPWSSTPTETYPAGNGLCLSMAIYPSSMSGYVSGLQDVDCSNDMWFMCERPSIT